MGDEDRSREMAEDRAERAWEAEREAERVHRHAPAPAAGLLQGCEPYTFDFGDREIRAWLERNLTVEELTEHDRWLEGFPQRRYAFTFWRRLALRPYWLVTWPWQRRRQRHLRRFSRLAEERGGPMPGPSWKIRTEWGTARGGV